MFVEVVFGLNIAHDVNMGRKKYARDLQTGADLTPFAFYTSAEMNIAICRVKSSSFAWNKADGLQTEFMSKRSYALRYFVTGGKGPDRFS